jgi:hypothetical protein
MRDALGFDGDSQAPGKATPDGGPPTHNEK